MAPMWDPIAGFKRPTSKGKRREEKCAKGWEEERGRDERGGKMREGRGNGAMGGNRRP